MASVMLTTVDNPYDPFTDWDNWLAFDVNHGYNSCGLLARLTDFPDKLSEEEQEFRIHKALNLIVDNDPNYKIVFGSDDDSKEASDSLDSGSD